MKRYLSSSRSRSNISDNSALGDQLLRVDLAERLARQAHDARVGHRPFVPDPSLSTSLGLKADAVARLFRNKITPLKAALLDQRLIAGLMPMAVVEGLEVVGVDHHHRQRLA